MKILCIIQARMGSERLPGKIMKMILDKPMITYTLDRTMTSKYIDEVVLATTENDCEDPMVEYLEANYYNVFRGDENNVLKRYVDTVNLYNGDIIIRITGDCPFIDPIIIDQVITYFLTNNFEFVRVDVPENFIRGFDVEVFTRQALEKVYDISRNIEGDSPYKEHVTLYMYKHPEEFIVGKFEGSEFYQKDYRLCVDTKEDFELVRLIYEHFKNKYVTSKEIVQFLDEHKEISQINQGIKQKHV
ncbi:spore coat polysaccharide biosynthesis protein SpsF [Mobilisporobacter senegalensis]|uniref:Spore coat polysaccharide biosynthesis protein SpsF n=1 Tax=Mobilisporobacter senegalensis TaxID=1329262 RepID=A0A3N1XZ32_9FIRM|nr:glycosyltransferase family protein [Mobilisporobacter senegalensis]ROR31538.1 spore coat polysaccharide biosynthesis protein SpsF [Mobilisporobacter senegalensis]